MSDVMQPMTTDQAAASVLSRMFGGNTPPPANDDAEKQPLPGEVKPVEAEAEEDPQFFEFPAEKEGDAPRRVPVDDVLAGYQKAGTLEQELAKTREEMATKSVLPDDIEIAMRETLGRREALGQAIEQWSRFGLPPLPDRRLLDPAHEGYDPTGFNTQLQAWEKGQAAMKHAEEVHKQNHAQQAREQQMLLESAMVKERHALLKAWPDVVKEDVQKELVTYASSMGYKPEELQKATSRDMLVLRDAMELRALKAKQQEAVRAVIAKPKLVRGAPSGSRNPASGQFQTQVNGFLQTGGSSHDAAAAYLALMKKG